MREALLGVAVVLGSAGAAMGHSPLKVTTPANDSVLATAPKTIELAFQQPMRLVAVSLTGSGVDESLDVSGADEPVADHELPAPSLAPGAYAVEWRGMAEDGHIMTGTFSFTVE